MTFTGPARLGDYLLVERIGEGGMAEVFRAQYGGDEHSVGPQSAVVIKRIKPELFQKPEFPIFREMFLNEAKLVRSMQHPNLARVYALLEATDDKLGQKVPFIVGEYIRGNPLWELMRIATRGFTGQGLPPGIAAYIAREVARGLGHAHAHKDAATGKMQPIIHRDISPENIMVSVEGQVKVIDFGVAKAVGGLGPQTRTGIIKGKLAYMSPEQVAQKVIPATDVFGAGIVLHEMLTGRRLFGGPNDFIVISRVLKAEIPRPSTLTAGIPPELEEVVMTALSRDLKVRYIDGNAMADALARAMAKVPELRGITGTTIKHWGARTKQDAQQIASGWEDQDSALHVDLPMPDSSEEADASSSGDFIELAPDDLMKDSLDGGEVDPGVREVVSIGLKEMRGSRRAGARSSTPSLSPELQSSSGVRPVARASSPAVAAVTKAATPPAVKPVTPPAVKSVTPPAQKSLPASPETAEPSSQRPITPPQQRPITAPPLRPVTKPPLRPITKPPTDGNGVPALRPVTKPPVDTSAGGLLRPVTRPPVTPPTPSGMRIIAGPDAARTAPADAPVTPQVTTDSTAAAGSPPSAQSAPPKPSSVSQPAPSSQSAPSSRSGALLQNPSQISQHPMMALAPSATSGAPVPPPSSVSRLDRALDGALADSLVQRWLSVILGLAVLAVVLLVVLILR
jgi:serine/threonine-protein kinase